MAERKPVAWITKGGKHIPIFVDTPSSDEIKKEKQINANKQQSDKLNSNKTDYLKYDSNADMVMELYRRTGINFTGNLSTLDKEVLAEQCEVLEDLQNKYHINEATDINHTSEYRLEVHVPLEYENKFKVKEGDAEDAFAVARLCYVALNPKYYALPKKELNDIYAESTEGYEPFHPKGTTSKDIIVHEVAHHMLDRQVWEMCGRDADKYFKVQEFLTDKTEYDGTSNTTLPEIKTLFGKFDKVRKKYIQHLKNDPEASNYLGSFLNDNSKLTYMANTKNFGRYGLCKYAGTNYHELVAEAFADWYANGTDATELSKMVVFEILNIE